MINQKKTSDRSLTSSNSGFTLIEQLIIIFIIGVLGAIAIPSWLGFIYRHRLASSTGQLQWAFKMAQSDAKREKTAWQVSIKETPKNILFTIHPASIPPVKIPAGSWKTLEPGIIIDDKQPNPKGKLETSLRKINPTTNKVTTTGTMYRALFNYKGCPVYLPNDECTQTSLLALGRIGLYHRDLGKTKRCVIISTALGVTRVGKENTKPNDDRYCY
jgi:type II secretory pathway pseudopilin PulG